jgi:hypothetical protein
MDQHSQPEAMDIDVNNVAMQGRQARAQVIFRPKTGAPPCAGMQVAYQLEKRDSTWVVVKTEAAGGMIDHPAANANPHAQPYPGLRHDSVNTSGNRWNATARSSSVRCRGSDEPETRRLFIQPPWVAALPLQIREAPSV